MTTRVTNDAAPSSVYRLGTTTVNESDFNEKNILVPHGRLLHLGTEQKVCEEKDVTELTRPLRHLHQEPVLHQLPNLRTHRHPPSQQKHTDTDRLSLNPSWTHLSFRRGDSRPARIDLFIDAGQKVLGYSQSVLKQWKVRMILWGVFQQVLVKRRKQTTGRVKNY